MALDQLEHVKLVRKRYGDVTMRVPESFLETQMEHVRTHSDAHIYDRTYTVLDEEGEGEMVMPPDWDLRPSWTIPIRRPAYPHSKLPNGLHHSTWEKAAVTVRRMRHKRSSAKRYSPFITEYSRLPLDPVVSTSHVCASSATMHSLASPNTDEALIASLVGLDSSTALAQSTFKLNSRDTKPQESLCPDLLDLPRLFPAAKLPRTVFSALTNGLGRSRENPDLRNQVEPAIGIMAPSQVNGMRRMTRTSSPVRDQSRQHTSHSATSTHMRSSILPVSTMIATSVPLKTSNSTDLNIEGLLRLSKPEWDAARTELLNAHDLFALGILDVLQTWLDRNSQHEGRRAILRLLIDIASVSKMFPKTLFVTGLSLESQHPISYGGFADVYRGSLKDQTIALKRLRINDQGHERRDIHRKFCKESLTWRQLSHPNILPFLGIDEETFKDINALGLVSPWMNCGTIMDYVRASEYDAVVHRSRLIIEVAEGLKYLHNQGLAHGDLHGSNIFMTDDGHPCLADFGLTVISDMTLSHDTTTTMNLAGAARWLAPELLSHDKAANRRSRAGDVFAFGRLCLALCTTRRPFHEIPDISVLFLMIKGERPSRPTQEECPGLPLPDNLWTMMNWCWEVEPSARPDMSTVINTLQMKDYPNEQDEGKVLTNAEEREWHCICM